jgi:hypothetical protein
MCALDGHGHGDIHVIVVKVIECCDVQCMWSGA